jgi:Reverse transcriptase (RNA-dependent DNA polymerase)
MADDEATANMEWTKFSADGTLPIVNMSVPDGDHCDSLSVLCVNCGRGGLPKSAKSILDVLFWLHTKHHIPVDILVLNELHMRPGEVAVLPGYTLIWDPRPSCPPQHCIGGVGFAVRDSLELVQDPVLVHRSTCGDFSLLRLQLPDIRSPLFIGSVYIPPNGQKLCRSDCTNTRCLKSHLMPLLGDIASSVIRHTSESDANVLIAGDLNVRFGIRGSREQAIQKELLELCPTLRHVNPRDGAGFLRPTRQDPSSGVETVLDTVYWAWAKHCGGAVHSTVIRSLGDGSDLCFDHFPILVMVPCGDGIMGSEDRSTQTHKTPEAHKAVQQLVGPPVPSCLLPRSVEPFFLMSDEKERESVRTAIEAALKRHVGAVAKEPLTPAIVTEGLLVVDNTVLRLAREKRVRSSKVSPKHIGEVNQTAGVMHHSLGQRKKSAHACLCELRREIVVLQRNGLQPSPELKHLVDHYRCQRKLERKQARLLSRAWQKAVVAESLSNVQLFLSLGRSTAQSKHRLFRALSEQANGNPVRHKTKRRPTSHSSQEKLRHLSESCARKYSAKVPCDPVQAKLVQDANRRRGVLKVQMAEAAAAMTKLVVHDQDLNQAILKMSSSSSVIGPVTPALLKEMNTLEFRKVLLPWIQNMFDTGSLPARLCVIKAFLIHKSGDPNEFVNYRVIGVGDVWSRLIQTIVWLKLEEWFRERNIISDCQFGFVRGRSAEMAAATAMMTSETLRSTGHCVWKIYVDIKGAFPSVNHSLLLGMLADHGIAPSLWRVLDSWFTQMQMYVQVDGIRSCLFPVDLGVPEGGVPSGGMYDFYEEYHIRAIRKAAVEMAGPSRCLWRQLHVVVTIIVYADDIVIIVCWYEAAQYFVNVLLKINFKLLLTMNYGENKTATQVELPYECTPEQANTFLTTGGSLKAGNVTIPQTRQYKHVGVWQSAEGREQSAALRTAKLEPVLTSILAKSIRCHSKAMSIGTCAVLLRQYWLPQVAFAMGLTYSRIPELVEKKFNQVMKTLAGNSFLPHVVLRKLFGMLSWDTLLNVDKLRLLLKILSDNGLACRVLEAQVACWFSKSGSAVTNQMWWSSVHSVLSTLDSIGATVSVTDTVELSWMECVMTIIQCGEKGCPGIVNGTALSRELMLKAALEQYKAACMLDECARQRAEIDKLSSLSEVRELLIGPNTPPFTVEPRSHANTWRVLCRGGVRVAFGHSLMHYPKCPWCGLVNKFTVPHLVRDCEAWAIARHLVYSEALLFGLESGVMLNHDVRSPGVQQYWYLLTVGAAVPNAFCNLGLEADTHFARNKRDRVMISLMNQSLPTYLKLLRITGAFLSRVMWDTATLLKCEVPPTPKRWSNQQKRSDSARKAKNHRKPRAKASSDSEGEWEFVTDTDDSEFERSCSIEEHSPDDEKQHDASGTETGGSEVGENDEDFGSGSE